MVANRGTGARQIGVNGCECSTAKADMSHIGCDPADRWHQPERGHTEHRHQRQGVLSRVLNNADVIDNEQYAADDHGLGDIARHLRHEQIVSRISRNHCR